MGHIWGTCGPQMGTRFATYGAFFNIWGRNASGSTTYGEPMGQFFSNIWGSFRTYGGLLKHMGPPSMQQKCMPGDLFIFSLFFVLLFYHLSEFCLFVCFVCLFVLFALFVCFVCFVWFVLFACFVCFVCFVLFVLFVCFVCLFVCCFVCLFVCVLFVLFVLFVCWFVQGRDLNRKMVYLERFYMKEKKEKRLFKKEENLSDCSVTVTKSRNRFLPETGVLIWYFYSLSQKRWYRKVQVNPGHILDCERFFFSACQCLIVYWYIFLNILVSITQ